MLEAGPMELLFLLVFLGVAAVVVAGIVTALVLVVRNARTVRRAGHDPATLQATLAVRAAEALAPPRTLEERLRELDDLRARGVITEQEHAAARSRALGG